MSKVSPNDLKAAAKDLQDILDADPPVYADVEEEELKARILEASELLEPSDNIKETTKKVIESLKGPGDSKSEKKTEVKDKKEPVKEERKKEQKKPEKKDFSKSNKAIIYLAWKKGEQNPETLHKIVKESIEITTIRNWINEWKREKNLPAIAKK